MSNQNTKNFFIKLIINFLFFLIFSKSYSTDTNKFQLKDLMLSDEYEKNHPKSLKIIHEAHESLLIPLKFDCLLSKIDKKDYTKSKFGSSKIIVMEQALIKGEEGAVISLKYNKLIFDSVIVWGDETRLTHKLLNSEINILEKIEGTVAVISSTSQYCYYHWLLDVLPRVLLLKMSGMSFDKIVLPNIKLNFQKESVEFIKKFLKLEEHKILCLNEMSSVEAKKILLPSIVTSDLQPSSPQWAHEFIRESFLVKQEKSKNKKLYISRSLALSRRILNEEKLIEMLKFYDFEVVNLEGNSIYEGGSIYEQAKLFNSAEVIVSPHGAGLTNIVFCTPGTFIFELYNPSWINPCFWHISQQTNLNHFSIMGHQNNLNEQQLKDYDYSVDVTQIQKILDIYLKKSSNKL